MAKGRTTLIISEHTFAGRAFEAAWLRAHPADTILHFHTTPMGAFTFDVPRALPLSQVPIFQPMALKRREWQSQDGRPSIMNGPFLPLFRAADHIVCATDADPQGARNFFDLLDQYAVETPLSEITWLPCREIAYSDIDKVIAADRRADDPELKVLLGHGRAKQYFDHLYILNALPVFGAALRAAGASAVDGQHFLSKFSLQALLVIDRLVPETLTEGDALGLMKNPLSRHHSPIGSPTSKGEIWTWLTGSGCLRIRELSSRGRAQWEISETGRRLLSLIHKDCFDPDLAHRILLWGEDWPAGRPKIDRYIRTFFGKQKRHQDRVILGH